MKIHKLFKNIFSMILLLFIFIGQEQIYAIGLQTSNKADILWNSNDSSENRSILALSYKQQQIGGQIPKEATDFALANYLEVLSVSYPYYENIDSANWERYSLGTPYIIYNPDVETVEEVYYYPILFDHEIVFILSVIHTTEGWTLSATNDIAEELNQIDYAFDPSPVFCEMDNHLIALYENDYKIVQEYESSNDFCLNLQEKEFLEEPYLDQIAEVKENIQNMQPVDIEQIFSFSKNEDIKEEYSPSFSENRNSGSDVVKICALYNVQTQGSYGICWAASVATIINYRLGTNYSAKNICDKLGTGYVGADINIKQKALKSYGITYYQSGNQLNWSVLTKNINNKYPIAASTFNAKGDGHAMTIYGYRFRASNKWIVMVNPANKNTITALYKTSNTTYTFDNQTWTWTKSLYGTLFKD